MAAPKKHIVTPEKAGHIKWFDINTDFSQTEIAIRLKLNVGQVSHVVNGHRFPEAKPTPPPEFA